MRREANWVSDGKPLFSEATWCSTYVSDKSASSIKTVDEQAARSGGGGAMLCTISHVIKNILNGGRDIFYGIASKFCVIAMIRPVMTLGLKLQILSRTVGICKVRCLELGSTCVTYRSVHCTEACNIQD